MIRDEVLVLKGNPYISYLQLLKHIYRFHIEYESEPNEENNDKGSMVWGSEPISVSIDFARAMIDFNDIIRVTPLKGLEAYDQYKRQVLYGENVDGFEYSYYGRLREYAPDGQIYDQIGMMIKRLKDYPQTRRGISITWKPDEDPFNLHTPCLQLIQCQIDQQTGKLEMQTIWRSRDMFKAWPMNVYAMLYLMWDIAKAVNVVPGIYRDYSIHPHIYMEDIPQIERLIR